ncbi:hypothetical protein BgAZ_102100 [Babesia gibsoni]|uniref:Uncharacterized protein n=1 Tax=Babesia gibsoni TaxID=33632 RepID=A0AAD8PFD3_BABGI|nr:hypothetical protein BgAZ_102100 [Babesia gibsoni]
MLSNYATFTLAGGGLAVMCPWRLQCVRHRASISSFKQWKDLLIFKRYDGHHVWCLPQHKPHEYGFRRIARKPPFFKMRKVSFPIITKEYSPRHQFNRTLQVEYNWQSHAALYHDFNDAVQEHMPEF